MKVLFLLVAMVLSASVMAADTWKAVGFMQLSASNSSVMHYLPYTDAKEFDTKANCDGFVNGVNALDPVKTLKGSALDFRLDAVCVRVPAPL